MRKNICWLLGACLALATTTLEAKVTLPALLADNAVLQRNDEVLLWGEATPLSTVTIDLSWSESTYITSVDKQGKWQIKVATGDASIGNSITFFDGEEAVTIDNILLGEVWVCAGQSNMEMPMRGFPSQPTAECADIILKANESTPIRYFKVERKTSTTVLDNVVGEWGTHTPEVVASFTATGYFFANYIQEVLGVPVGIIDCSWGGSKIEAWMSREMLSGVKEYDFSHLDRGETVEKPQLDLCYMYNGMLAPVTNYAIKGMLWYQGESNRHIPTEYLDLFPAFVSGLRSLFDCGEFPFYYVEIAPYAYTSGVHQGAQLREVMGKLIDLVPNCGMATLIDAGEEKLIHPRNKRVAGERLAYLALGNTYDVGAAGSGNTPQYAEMQVLEAEGKMPERIAVRIKNAPHGVCFPVDKTSELFEVAGEDRIFYPAQTRLMIKNDFQVEAWSDQVPHPVAVRYAYKNFVIGDLYNTFGVPVPSFRSDNWEIK